MFSHTGGDAELPAASSAHTAKRSRSVAAGCQPAAAVLSPKGSSGSRSVAVGSEPAAAVLPRTSVKRARTVASGGQPALAVKEPKTETVAELLARSPKPIIPTRGKGASSSSSTAVFPVVSAGSTDMLDIKAKWKVDKGSDGKVKL